MKKIDKKKTKKINYSLIIPAYNAEKTIKYCLESVKKIYDKHNIEVIVCDNSSTDRTIEIIKKFPFKIIINKKKQTAGSTRNKGAMNSRYDNLIFLDSDCVAPKNLIRILEKTPNFYKQNCIAGNFSTNNIFKNFFSLYKTSYAHFKLKNQKDNVLNSAIMFIKKKHFVKVGMFNENLKSMEDDDFSIRFQNSGYFIYFNKNLEVHHYKKYNFYSLTKNDFLRSKQLVSLLFDNLKNKKIKRYNNWFKLYLKTLLNCFALLFNLLFIFFYLKYSSLQSIYFFNFKFIFLVNFLYLIINYDHLIFNLKVYNLFFSLRFILFQFFTYLTILSGLSIGMIEYLIKNFYKKKS